MGRLLHRLLPRLRPLLLSFGVAGASLWVTWPLLRPRLVPAAGPSWLVVLDGYHRLDWALQRQALSGESILLITCPSTGQPTANQWNQQQPIARSHPQAPQRLVVHQGFDTATQAVALAEWLQRRERQGQSIPRQLLLVSDAHHFPRAQWAAQVAAGSSGTEVLGLPLPTSSGPLPDPQWWLHWPSWRDALRLQLWRATGSTGAVLQSGKLERKIQVCFNAS